MQRESETGLRGWRLWLSDLAGCLRFFSRLPLPALPFEGDAHAPLPLARAARALPLAGLIIVLPGLLALALAYAVRLPDLVAAIFCVAALVLTTGAFHEDGLADCADGFGGGWSIERKLEIMKDSRLGTYGAAALFLALSARIALIAALLDRGGLSLALCWLAAAAALSRVVGLVPLTALPPARGGGASRDAGQPEPPILAQAIIFSLLIVGALGRLAGLDLSEIAGAAAIALLVGLGMTWLSLRQIRGQTGDVAGATQQLSEIVFLTAPLIFA